MSLPRRFILGIIASSVWIPLAVFADVSDWNRGWVCGLIVGAAFCPAWGRLNQLQKDTTK